MKTTMTEREATLLAKIEARKAERAATKPETQDEMAARLEAATTPRRNIRELRARSWMQLNPDRMPV